MISDVTLGLIYTCKQVGQTDVDLSNFLQQYYDSAYPYSREEIDDSLREAVIECIIHANSVNRAVRNYFLNTWIISTPDEHQRMVGFLAHMRVMEDGEYVNGMRENPFKDWEMFRVE